MKIPINRLKKITLLTISFTAIATSIIACYPKKDNNSTIADVNHIPKGTFKYGGSTTFAPLRCQTNKCKKNNIKNLEQTIKKVHPQFKLQYTKPSKNRKPGSGTGIKMLLEGELDFSESSRSVKPKEFKQAKDKEFQLQQKPVAIDAIAFYVNPELIQQGIKGITLDQARKIFIGEIQNWKDLKGPDIDIIPFSRDLKAGGTVDFFHHKVLKQQNFPKKFQNISSTTQGINLVANTPGGIGYATASEVVNQDRIKILPLAKNNISDQLPDFVSPCATEDCKFVDEKKILNHSYPLTRGLFVVVKRNYKLLKKDDKNYNAGIAYINILHTHQGRETIKKAGFSPMPLKQQ